MRDIVRAEPGDAGHVVRLVSNGRAIGSGLTAGEAHAWVATVNAHFGDAASLGNDPALLAAFALRLKTVALDRDSGGRARWGIAADADAAP